MIGTFWSLCRACPSVPVDKLHSEYRSTYRWHEYTGPRQEIIRRPPQNTIIGQAAEPALHRRRKHPELAYRAHEFLVARESHVEKLVGKSIACDRARSEERWKTCRQRSSRRSKSEGPPAGQPSYRLIYTKTERNNKTRVESEFNDENEAPPGAMKSSAGQESSEYRLQFAWPPVGRVLDSAIGDQITPRKSVSMNGIRSKGISDTVPVHRKSPRVTNPPEKEVLRVIKPNPESENLEERARNIAQMETQELKSEYRKNFQPFNKYEFDENKGIFEKRVMPVDVLANDGDMESPSSSWYKEVMLLRKKANQYRHRGWGTELVPDHIAQLYSNQMLVWEQVSRRSSLSALSLASSIITKDRSSLKEEKEKENRRNSPSKSLSRLRTSRLGQEAIDARSGFNKKNMPHVRNVIARSRLDSSPDKGNTRGKKSAVERSSPKNCSRNASNSAPPAPHAKMEPADKPKRRPRPTSLVTSVPSGSKTALVQLRKEETDEQCADNVPDFPELASDQIVKSPPEPTRVKSPEQIVLRSPEPVNWTVPLDTGKTFTVTQNVREGDFAPRSYSEVRAWTPNSAQPPPASISAPMDLIELAKTNVSG